MLRQVIVVLLCISVIPFFLPFAKSFAGTKCPDISQEEVAQIARDASLCDMAVPLFERMLRDVRSRESSPQPEPQPQPMESQPRTLLDILKETSQQKKRSVSHSYGAPFQVYAIRSSDLLAYSPGEDLESMLIPGEWLVPVFMENEPLGLMAVGCSKGTWKVVGGQSHHLL